MRFLRHVRPIRTGFLTRLLHDRRANTLVLMAIALVPISAMAGSAVDMARLYVVKSRLQQACDAGVLAGRKFMAPTGTVLDPTATAQAKAFFANNLEAGWFDTGKATFVPTRTTDSQVAGTAEVKVPMTIMKMFAVPDTTITVACQARYDIADTDVVFVLDTTGSMACRPEDSSSQCNSYVGANPAQPYTRPSSDPDAVPGYLGSTGYAVPETSAGSRMKALRQAVKDFYATMAGSIDASTRIRYGFVTYTSTVNAGKAIQAISPAYLLGQGSSETVPYQSRRVTADYTESNARTSSNNGRTSDKCNVWGTRNPSTPLTYTSSGKASQDYYYWNSSTGRCETYTYVYLPRYTYREYATNVSQYLTGVSVADPSKVRGETSRWDGCIEERQTEAGATTFTSASYDLDPDLIPSSDPATRWKPMWADTTYMRLDSGEMTSNGESTSSSSRYSLGDPQRRSSGLYSCGKPIHRLTTMTSDQVDAYVDAADFRALGGTYHDTGMIWGTRLLSQKGIFSADNTGRAGQGTPKKVLIFLTDGDMAPAETIYGLYGIERIENRVSGTGTAALQTYHNARFLYECDRARQMGIDVWTVAIGLAATPELKQCARIEAQALSTTSGSGLSAAFQAIAKQVAMLRLQQ